MPMTFEKFRFLMNTIEDFRKKTDKINSFFEEEITDTWFMSKVGGSLEEALINLVADDFNCWYDVKENPKEWYEEGISYDRNNDISWWLYEAPEDKKIIEVNGKEKDITSLKDFYNYLIEDQESNLT